MFCTKKGSTSIFGSTLKRKVGNGAASKCTVTHPTHSGARVAAYITKIFRLKLFNARECTIFTATCDPHHTHRKKFKKYLIVTSTKRIKCRYHGK